VFGREIFDVYMAGYFDRFAFQAISTEQFLEYIDQQLLQAHPGIYSRQQLEEWLYRPGLPEAMTVPRSTSLERAAAAAQSWASGELAVDKLGKTDWSPQATVQFVKALPPDLSEEQLTELDLAMGLSTSGNAEIARAWFMEVARRRYLPACAAVRDHLGRFGRIRLIEPVYRELVQNGQDEALAREIFAALESIYHPLTVAAIERLFAVDEAP